MISKKKPIITLLGIPVYVCTLIEPVEALLIDTSQFPMPRIVFKNGIMHMVGEISCKKDGKDIKNTAVNISGLEGF